MKNLWKKLIIALALVLVMSAVPAQAHAADALAGAFLQVGLQAAGINFLQSWGSLTGLDAAKTAIARDLTDLFNSWAVAASKPYTTVQEFFEYYYPSQSWITVLSNFFKNPVTELYKAAIYINSNDIISALSDFAAWVKTEKFGANADSDGGTAENPTVSRDLTGAGLKATNDFNAWGYLLYGFPRSNVAIGLYDCISVPPSGGPKIHVVKAKSIYNYFLQRPNSTLYVETLYRFPDNSSFYISVTKVSETTTSFTVNYNLYYAVPGYSDTMLNPPSTMKNVVLKNSSSFDLALGYMELSGTSAKYVLLLNRRLSTYELDDVSPTNSSYINAQIFYYWAWPSKMYQIKAANLYKTYFQYQNTNNNQLPATIPSGETTVITPSGLTVIQSMTQAMAEQQVTINDLTYEIGALREQLDQQTTVIGQNTVLIGDLFDALDAVKVPVSDLSTAAAAIQAAESAANDTGQITINGVPYTLEEILTALASSTVTITDDEEEQHLVPADTVVGQILDTDLTPEAIANGIISVPVVEDTDGATVAPSVNVVTQTITVPVPTTAPTVGPTAIPTEGILPTVMPTGGVTAVPTTIPGETEVEAIQALPEAIASAIANIFVPDAELITGIYNTINGKFAFIQQMANFLNQILSVQEEIPAIYIYPHNKGATSTLEYAPADVERILVLDMTWYVPYRETVNNIISGFLWLAFLWAFWKRIPGIISGASVITDKYTYSHREWGE